MLYLVEHFTTWFCLGSLTERLLWVFSLLIHMTYWQRCFGVDAAIHLDQIIITISYRSRSLFLSKQDFLHYRIGNVPSTFPASSMFLVNDIVTFHYGYMLKTFSFDLHLIAFKYLIFCLWLTVCVSSSRLWSRAQLTLLTTKYHWYMQWLGAKQVSSSDHYLNQ